MEKKIEKQLPEGIKQQRYDRAIWKEIVQGLCEQHEITEAQLDAVFCICFSDYIFRGYMMFLDMPARLFWREIPKAIVRNKPNLWDFQRLKRERAVMVDYAPEYRIVTGGKDDKNF